MEPWKGADVPTHPLRKGEHWVCVTARIRENTTGEVREYHDAHAIIADGEEHPSTYIWEDGNYACDCNRGLFFQYAAGVAPDDADSDCGDGRFSVQLINPQTGTVYYDEFT